jgi:hypothetical protein
MLLAPLLTALARWWILSCAVLTTLLVGTRALPYVPSELTAPGLLSTEIKFVAIGSHLLRPLMAPLFLVFVLLLWSGRRRWRDAGTGRWATPPWVAVVIYTGLLIAHGAFDFDPAVAAPAWLSLPLLLWCGWTRRLAAHGPGPARVGILVAAAALVVPWATAADTPGDVVGLALWAAAWLLLTSRGHHALALRDRGWLGALALGAAQLSAAFFPLVLPTHGGTQLGDDMAYTWCQRPEGPRLFAAVTGCPTTPGLFVTQGACQAGHLAEIDARTMEVVARHRPLTPDFFGRIEQVVCLPDGRLRLGMADGIIDGVPWRDNTALFDPDDPSRLVRRVLDADIGHRLVYDPRHHATVYVSEHTGKVFRVDERTGAVDRSLGRELGLGDEGGSRVTSDGALHDARDTVYLGDWMSGSSVHELARADGAHRRTFDTRGGGMFEVTVDEPLDRVYASQGWGVDVIDLKTGEVVFSRRTGFMARRPAIDTVHDLVYIPSTTDGKVRVFDRRTLEPIGAFRVGYGPRDAYITRDGRRLLTSSAWGMYTWSTRDLARRFGRGT